MTNNDLDAALAAPRYTPIVTDGLTHDPDPKACMVRRPNGEWIKAEMFDTLAAEVRRLSGKPCPTCGRTMEWADGTLAERLMCPCCELKADLAALRQRHAAAVEKAERAVIDWMWTEDPLCDNADETWTAWLASEARKAVARDE